MRDARPSHVRRTKLRLTISQVRFLASVASVAVCVAGLAVPAGAEEAEGEPAPMASEEGQAPAGEPAPAEETAAASEEMPPAVPPSEPQQVPPRLGPTEPVREPPATQKPDEDEKEQRAARESKARQKATARVAEARYKAVRSHYLHAARAYRAGRYGTAVEWSNRALALDPENLAVQRLKYTAELARQGRRLALEAEKDRFLDEESLAMLELENRFPDELARLPRPDLVLREEMPKSEAMRRMEERLSQRVSMNFIDADLDYVLQTLFKISGVDILAEQTVVADKMLTLHVENVPLSEILEFIKRNYEGIDYTVTENAVWLVSPESPPLVPRSYPLSRGLVSQGGFQMGVRTSSRTGLASSASGIPNPQQLAGMSPAELGRALGRLTGGRGGQQGQQQGEGAAAGKGGDSYLESVLTWVESWEDEWPQGSKWWLDRQTNTLLVLTTQKMHDRMEELLDVMDTVPVQVLVRTKFIEVLADDLKEYGVSSIGYQEWTGKTLVDTVSPEGTSIGTSAMGGSTEGMQVLFGRYLSNKSQLTAALNALEKRQRTRVLSAPQIIAMNNTPATIDISKTFSYASQYQATTGTIVNNDQSISIPNAMVPSQFEEINVGFYLEFIPSVGRDRKNIVLDLRARVDDVVGEIEDFQSIPIIIPGEVTADGGTGGIPGLGTSSTQAVQRPVVDGREFQTRLVVEDGGTVVIGGLLKNYNERVTRKVPVLGDIPILGLLFRYHKDTLRQSNLVIVVQAHIVAPSGQYYAAGANEAASDRADPYSIRAFSRKAEAPEWIEDLAPEIVREVYEGERQ